MLDVRKTQGISDQDWPAQAKRFADDWARNSGVSRANQDNGQSIDQMSKLVVQVMHFARDISSQSDSFESDFHVQFMHAINARAPGFAWVVVAEREGFDVYTIDGFRAGGGAGVQIPLIGSRDLWVKDGEGQVVLRLLPIAGNYETVEVGPDPENRVPAPNTGIIVRPTAELEASIQTHGIRPGFRFLAQPRLLDPTQARMLAEVYVDLDISTANPILKSISIVPRCVIDLSNDVQTVLGPNADAYNQGYKFLNKDETCSLSAEFTLGM